MRFKSVSGNQKVPVYDLNIRFVNTIHHLHGHSCLFIIIAAMIERFKLVEYWDGPSFVEHIFYQENFHCNHKQPAEYGTKGINNLAHIVNIKKAFIYFQSIWFCWTMKHQLLDYWFYHNALKQGLFAPCLCLGQLYTGQWLNSVKTINLTVSTNFEH